MFYCSFTHLLMVQTTSVLQHPLTKSKCQELNWETILQVVLESLHIFVQYALIAKYTGVLHILFCCLVFINSTITDFCPSMGTALSIHAAVKIRSSQFAPNFSACFECFVPYASDIWRLFPGIFF